MVILPAVLAVLPGCGGGGGGGGGTVDVRDCERTSADALVSMDDNPNNELVLNAVTSDCDQVTVFSGNGQAVRQVIIVARDNNVTAEFDADGQLVVARTTGNARVNVSYNGGLSYARVTYDDDNVTSSTLVSVSRDPAGRAGAQNTTALEGCSQLRQLAGILSGNCGDPNPPPYCSGAFDGARQAAETLCSAEALEVVSGFSGLSASQVRTSVPLGVEGFATTRAAAAGGTTIVLTSSAFGGEPPYQVRWRQTEGASAALTQLPGGAALADISAAGGAFAFETRATDGAGASATAAVEVDLAAASLMNVVIQASNMLPAAGEEVTFNVAGADAAAASIFWDFGDGTTSGGRMVTHAYPTGVYQVTVAVAVADRVLTNTVEIAVGGADPQMFAGEMRINLDLGSAPLSVEEMRTIRADVTGAIGSAEVAIGILDGFDVADLGGAGLIEEDLVVGRTADLTGVGPGVVVLGAVAVDAAGRVAETIESVAVCGAGSGLLVLIDGPDFMTVGFTETFLATAVSCSGSSQDFTYGWFLGAGGASIGSPDSAQTTITPTSAGPLRIQVIVRDGLGREASAFRDVFVESGRLGELFVAFLGPFGLPPGSEAPLVGFVSGAGSEVFCSWHLDDPDGSPLQFVDPFTCQASVVADRAGCATGSLIVQDSFGALGSTTFEICSDPGFTPPVDCPYEGFCDVDCDYLDADCLQDQFCVPGDFLCDPQCPADSDCTFCEADGLCVLLCPTPDPDCFRDVCVGGDFICDFGCLEPDPDCAEADCIDGDGLCDPFCPVPDADCDVSNAELCAASALCCDGDGNCELENCPEFDVDCAACIGDGLCVALCVQLDPDCPPCDLTFGCDEDCPGDPECALLGCDVTFGCDPNCPDDPECLLPCDVTFGCDPDCPGDPECLLPCDVTFGCDPNCPGDPECP
jgi:PKD repeat protein